MRIAAQVAAPQITLRDCSKVIREGLGYIGAFATRPGGQDIK